MRLIYFDIDTLRADHLGCYGYPRPTSPTIDALAAGGIRFDNVHASDTPCLPSRSALCSGQFGIRNGSINHGGPSTDPFPEGRERQFQTALARNSWMTALREVGMWTASISTFAERHSAYHFEAGFNECFNLGTRGLETADQVAPVARDWLARNGSRPDWFLHVHLWDPHTPYRTPAAFGDPFLDSDAVPSWLTEEVRAAHWALPGPHSAQEIAGFSPRPIWDRWVRQPQQAADLDAVARVYNGYDTGVRYADHHVGQILDALDGMGLLEETAVLVSSDHGENLGELGVYCDHQTADQFTTRLPAVLRWPGLDAGSLPAQDGFHYQIDLMATVLELCGASVPERWDGESFATGLRAGSVSGRDHLVLSHAAWTAQRSVRFGEWLCMETYWDAYHGYPDIMLFDLASDPYEQHDVASDRPEVVQRARSLLHEWKEDAMSRSDFGIDPMWSVLHEGGPWHSRVDADWYLERLDDTGRGRWADQFRARKPFSGWSGSDGVPDSTLGPESELG